LECARKETLHCYNKHQHLIFKYHYKSSTEQDRLNQQKRELVEQTQDSQMKLKSIFLSRYMNNLNGTNSFTHSQ
jgi:hypothetical protein